MVSRPVISVICEKCGAVVPAEYAMSSNGRKHTSTLVTYCPVCGKHEATPAAPIPMTKDPAVNDEYRRRLMMILGRLDQLLSEEAEELRPARNEFENRQASDELYELLTQM